MPKLQGLIFDLDGTLVDSAPDLRFALNQTLAEYGRRSVTLDETKHMVGDGLLVMLQRAFVATGAALDIQQSYEISKIFLAKYQAQTAMAEQIYPHVVDVLTGFAKNGVRLGLCTNKQEAATHKLLKELDLARHFSFVAGGDTYPQHKPHPDHVRGVIERLNVPKEGCVMVGDSTNDVLAAKGAGIACVVVTHGYGFDVTELGADRLIGGMNELKGALESLGF